jgi:hypothetical protein
LYGTAKSCPRGVTIYLVPGLTGRQRKAVIRRLRQEASRGCGPELPLAALLIALVADRVRVAVGLTTAAVRLHPAGTLLPAGFVAAAMMLLVLVSAGVRPVPAVAAGRAATTFTGTPYTGSAVRLGHSASDASPAFDSAVSASAGQGEGGRGLVAAQRPLTTGRARPRTARVCFGAMPGMAAQHGHPDSDLACRQTRPALSRRAHPDSQPLSG